MGRNSVYGKKKDMKIWRFLVGLFLLAVPTMAHAQFFVVGDNPASVRWNTMQTAHYKLVYPMGLDSLARVYGRTLEQYRPSNGTTVGYEPGQYTRGKIPVVFHAYNAMSNGSVAWAPSRVDLYTSPDPFKPDPQPWVSSLVIHEQRHVAQMQVGLSPGTFRALGYVFGEMFNGFVAGVYMTGYIEGDAVVAETAFSRAGRGRTADFLNYYMIAFDNGDMRSMFRWRVGSQKSYFPNVYAFGYMQLAGMRYLYGRSDLFSTYYEYIARRPYHFWGFGRKIYVQYGMYNKEVFKTVTDSLRTMWGEEIAARAPYTPYSEVGGHEKRYVQYANGVVAGQDVYSVRSGIARPAALVRMGEDGKWHTVRAFASTSGKLAYSEQNHSLYWSEYGYDARWSMKANSIIRAYDVEKGGARTLTHKGRLFSPSVSEDGTMLAATQNYDDGRTGVLVLDAVSGDELGSVAAPDSLQVVETAWLDGRIYATAISENGIGIYSIGVGQSGTGGTIASWWYNPNDKDSNAIAVEGGGAQRESVDNQRGTKNFKFTPDWREELAPQPAKADGLRARDGSLYLSSDRLGVRDLYRFDPATGELFKLTSSKYGADDYSFNAAGDTLYYSLKQYEGDYVVSTPTDSLFNALTDPTELFEWKLADNITRQENEISWKNAVEKGYVAEGDLVAETDEAPAEGDSAGGATERRLYSSDIPYLADPDTVQFTDPKRYRKGGHLFRFHSWAPVYFNIDNIMSLSYDHIYDLVSLGIAGISQNDLGTAITQVGYSAHKDPYNRHNWKHSGHATFTYTGWYPVIEASIDFNDRSARNRTYLLDVAKSGSATIYSSSRARKAPYVLADFTVYIPFNFSRGGWSTGLIPQVYYSVSNDYLIKDYRVQQREGDPSKDGYEFYRGDAVILHRLSGSVRGYTMRPTADSGVYPRWGVGAQIGASFRPGLTDYYSPVGYFYLYGYTPGVSLTQGLKLTCSLQTRLDRSSYLGDSGITVLPRGLTSNSTLEAWVEEYSNTAIRITGDYAIPIATGDASIAGYFLYFSRLILTPHFDYTILRWSPSVPFRGDLYSIGASLTIDLRSTFWIKFPFEVGVSVSYNGGSAFSSINPTLLANGHKKLSHIYVGPVFSVSL